MAELNEDSESADEADEAGEEETDPNLNEERRQGVEQGTSEEFSSDRPVKRRRQDSPDEVDNLFDASIDSADAAQSDGVVQDEGPRVEDQDINDSQPVNTSNQETSLVIRESDASGPFLPYYSGTEPRSGSFAELRRYREARFRINSGLYTQGANQGVHSQGSRMARSIRCQTMLLNWVRHRDLSADQMHRILLLGIYPNLGFVPRPTQPSPLRLTSNDPFLSDASLMPPGSEPREGVQARPPAPSDEFAAAFDAQINSDDWLEEEYDEAERLFRSVSNSPS
ncbi:hypothetical protein F4804DRAFT_336728 [Jackrogersella minutella]|nr:hypothetical protein F4804DRAFT_336728 [Jackrogersella minutella]